MANESKADTMRLPLISHKPQILFLHDLDIAGGKTYWVNESMATYWEKKALIPLDSITHFIHLTP